MTTFVVTEVLGDRPWSTNAGASFVDYTLQLEGEPKQVRLTQKPDTAAPKVGDSLDLTLEDFPPEQVEKYAPLANMKKAKKVQQGGGGWSGGGGGARTEDPKRSARILRQHSQDMAIQVIRLALEMAIIEDKPASLPDLLSLVRRTADYLDHDVTKVGDAA